MMLNMRAGAAQRPSILIAYALCEACDEETCGDAALAALRHAVAAVGVSSGGSQENAQFAPERS